MQTDAQGRLASPLQPLTRHLPELAVVLTALAAVALLFPGVSTGREHLWGDFVTWYYPSHEYAAQSLRQGQWPLWNPYSDCGMPFAGEADHGSFYPPSWLLHAVAPDRARLFHGLEIFALLHIAWAILTLYGLLRSLGCGRLASLAGGLSYGLGGAFSARAAQVSLTCAQAWVPVAIGGLVHALRRSSRWGFALSAAAVGLIGLSGSPATLVVTLVGLGFVAAPVVLFDSALTPLWRRALGAALLLAGIALSGVLLAGVQLLPMKEFVDLSERSAYTYEQITYYSVSPASLILLLIPRFYGWLNYDMLSYWGPNNYVELSGYAGLLPLLLGLLALRFRPRRETMPWLVLAALSLWTALGSYGGFHWLLYRTVPVLGQMRAPGRYLLLWALGVAVLGGLGLDALLREGRLQLGFAWQRWLRALMTAALAFILAVLLIRPAVLLLLQPWQMHFFAIGTRTACACALGAALALWLLGRSRTPLAAAAVVLLVANDLTLQGRGIGVVPESQMTRELREPSGGYEALLLSDPTLFRVKNHYEGPGDLMLARLQSDFGPGRHVLAYQELTERILSHAAPLFDALNIKYLGEIRPVLVQAPVPNLIAQQYVWLNGGHDALLAVEPPLLSSRIEMVSTVATVPGLKPGDTAGTLELDGTAGEKVVIPIRLAIETGDMAQGAPAGGAREIMVTYYIDVTDAAALQNRHYLADLHFAPLRIARIRLRHTGGGESQFAIKELYVWPAEGEPNPWRLVHTQGAAEGAVLDIFENTAAAPRAFLVPEVHVAASHAEALGLVAREGFDPRRELVLEEMPPVYSGGTAGAAVGRPVEVKHYAAEEIVLAAEAEPNGSWLLLSEVDFPGWTAAVDGRPARIFKADALFRAVHLDPGRHEIVFRYAPASFRNGAMLTGLGGAGLLAAVALAWRRRG